MNDRYLFRAKRIDNGEWVEGCLLVLDDETYRIATSCLQGNEEHLLQVCAHEVDPSTICQCTGLKDKSGKLIWENDILVGHLDDMCPENSTYTQAIWYKNGFYTKEKGSDDILLIGEFDEKHFEVCGSIFDNPELLE